MAKKPKAPAIAIGLSQNAMAPAAAVQSGQVPSVDDLGEIQGNIFGGFNKDFQDFVFLKFNSATGGKAWVKEIADEKLAGCSSADVLKFNAQFKALKAAGIQPESVIAAKWVNLGLTFAGLQALGVTAGEIAKFPDAFRQGMKARAAGIGDAGASAPSQWEAPFDGDPPHAVLVLAADSEGDLSELTAEIQGMSTFAGVTVLGTINGRTRADQPGHEHFGFKDGISQPGIRGITTPDDPVGNPDQGHPGQDLLWPGEFVLGYPRQIPMAEPGREGFNRQPGPTAFAGPAWAKNGSYMVIRRLQQDVPAFHAHIADLAAANGLREDLMGAKLVGRYRSGCPIEPREFQAGPRTKGGLATDPGLSRPELADNDQLNNNFEFGDDAAGLICPRGAHIRKTYPRDQNLHPSLIGPDGIDSSEASTQTRRLLRRGIPFGRSYGAEDESSGQPNTDPRGLVFVAFQSDIERQFEFVQSSWVNEPSFPFSPPNANTPGQDPIIAQSPQDTQFELDPRKGPITVQHFVTTTGGDYFFAPSIDSLKKIETL